MYLLPVSSKRSLRLTIHKTAFSSFFVNKNENKTRKDAANSRRAQDSKSAFCSCALLFTHGFYELKDVPLPATRGRTH
ncbi:hypothetical protein TNCV_3172821 [Trichonephila clavipes]|nr:hypothetical protein TNCV_3172821 [Trichonephila clavipes]